MSRIYTFILGMCLLGTLCSPFFVHAEGEEWFSVAPVVVHEKAKARDILKQSLTLTNNTTYPLNIYAAVNNVDRNIGEQEFKVLSETDLSKSLANWIELTRGVIELAPGETKQVPYLIHVNLTAEPGLYHAKISFAEGTTRAEAETSPRFKELAVTIEVLDDAKERLELGTFLPDKTFFGGSSASFSYSLDNVGNRTLTPKGEVRIFNKRGEEVAVLPINSDGKSIEPDSSTELASVWDAAKKIGKYKAFLELEYGNGQTATVQDTVYFWVFPWKQVLVVFVLLAFLVIFGTLSIHNKYSPKAFAHVGALGKTSTSQSTRDSHSDGSNTETHKNTKKGALFLGRILRKKKKEEPVTEVAAVAPTPQDPPQHKSLYKVSLSKKAPSGEVSKHRAVVLTSRAKR